MTILRPSLCLALVVLCAGAYTTVMAQAPRSGQSHTATSGGKTSNLKLHEVSLGTKIKWGAQLLFYPEAIKPVRVFRAYKWDNICRGKQKDLERNLGFALVSSAQSGGRLETGKLIATRNKPVTLKTVCNSPSLSPAPGETKYLLILDGLQNQKGAELYWTNISPMPNNYMEILPQKKKRQEKTQ